MEEGAGEWGVAAVGDLEVAGRGTMMPLWQPGSWSAYIGIGTKNFEKLF